MLKDYSNGTSTNSKLYLHGQNDYPLIEKKRVSVTAETSAVYIYRLNGAIAKRVGSTVLFLLKDHLGSTRVVMDATGLVRSYYDYDAFGNLIRTGTTNEVKYQFTGQEFDESGLHNYRARLYDSDLGKFYAVDPAGQFASPFAYAGNNPVIFVDPTGTVFVVDDLLIAMAIGAAINTGMNAANGDINNVGDFFKSAGIGALGGAMGYSLAPGILINYVPVGAIQGFAYGAAVGGLTGGVTSSLSGNSFGSGFAVGAIGGGVIGGIQGYGLANRIGHNPWTGAELPRELPAVEPLMELNAPSYSSGSRRMPTEMGLAAPTIETYQVSSTEQAYVTMFETSDAEVSGYFLEPAIGTSEQAITKNSDRAIQRGTYAIGRNVGTKYPGAPQLLNVPGRSDILIHSGRLPANTTGCLLPGSICGVGGNFLGRGSSGPLTSQLTNWIRQQGLVFIRLR